MKLSELNATNEHITQIVELRDLRDEVHGVLEEINQGRNPDVSAGYHDPVTITGDGVNLVKAALIQEILDIEFELTTLGVEIDEPPNVEPIDDDAGAEGNEAEEAA